MHGKYSIYFIALYLIKYAINITPGLTQSSTIEDMEYLLKNQYWQKLSDTEQDLAIKVGNEWYNVTYIIARGVDGKIVNETNIEMKIRQYFTLLRYVFSDRLRVILKYLYALASKQKDTDDQKKSHEIVLGQIKGLRPLFILMKCSLKMLSEWYFIEYRNELISNDHITRAIVSLTSAPIMYSNDIDHLVYLLGYGESCLNDFYKQYVITRTTNTDENDIIKDIINNVNAIYSSEKNPKSIRKELKNYTKTIVTEIQEDIACLGFELGINPFQKSAHLVRDSKLQEKTKMVYFGTRTCV